MAGTSGVARGTRGPTGASERSLAPDLARGVMLLLIAVAHGAVFVADPYAGPAGLDRAAEFARSLLAENQARAMFVLLFGYGIGQLTTRMSERGTGWEEVRALLRRRGWWLLVVGFAHAALLIPFDIIAVYGTALLLAAGLVRVPDRVLWCIAALSLVPATGLLAWQSVTAHQAAAAGPPQTMAAYMEPDYTSHVVTMLPSWPVETLVSVVMVLPGMAVGIWAARRRLLDDPGLHAVLLRRVALAFIGFALLARMPFALASIEMWDPGAGALLWTVASAHVLSGYGGGLGLAALVGVVAVAVSGHGGRLVAAMTALGQRSMTFYLFQSLVFLLLFYPFTLDLSGAMGAAGASAVAVGVWVLSVVLAALMGRWGMRGPVEVLVRRLVYR